MKADFIQVPSWPMLAWCVHIQTDAECAAILHGPAVETRANWFCEGTWDSAFDDGAFAQSDCFFGSGAVLSDDAITFISSCAPMDRLYHIELDGRYLVSNSLACLLSQANADFDLCYSTFEEEAFSITKGIDVYQQTFPTTKGLVQMTVCRNLRYANGLMTHVDKTLVSRKFTDFEAYKTFLRSSLQKIAENMHCRARRSSYSYISGISTGYDSPAVCTLAKDAGLKEAFHVYPVTRGWRR
jgi:hypothetical protein